MCPLCFSTAALIAVSVTSTGGLAALAIRKFGTKNTPENNANRRNSDASHQN